MLPEIQMSLLRVRGCFQVVFSVPGATLSNSWPIGPDKDSSPLVRALVATPGTWGGGEGHCNLPGAQGTIGTEEGTIFYHIRNMHLTP